MESILGFLMIVSTFFYVGYVVGRKRLLDIFLSRRLDKLTDLERAEVRMARMKERMKDYNEV